MPQETPELVVFSTSVCPACKMQKPILTELAEELKGKVRIKDIDANSELERAEKEGIRAVPTLVFYDASHSEVFRREGVMRKEEILARLKDLTLLE